MQDLETNNDDSEIQNCFPKEESFHYCGMPLRKVGSRDAAFMHTQESDDFFRGNLLGPGFIVEDVTNDVTSDAHLSATIVPHVHSESDDEHKITNAGHESAMEVRNLLFFFPVLSVSLWLNSLVYCRKITRKVEKRMNHSAKLQWLRLKLESMAYR